MPFRKHSSVATNKLKRFHFHGRRQDWLPNDSTIFLLFFFFSFSIFLFSLFFGSFSSFRGRCCVWVAVKTSGPTKTVVKDRKVLKFFFLPCSARGGKIIVWKLKHEKLKLKHSKIIVRGTWTCMKLYRFSRATVRKDARSKAFRTWTVNSSCFSWFFFCLKNYIFESY